MLTRVAYFGLDNHTLKILTEEPTFTLVAIGDIEYCFPPSPNPFNCISWILYSARKRTHIRFFTFFLSLMWSLCRNMTTGLPRRYGFFLTTLLKHNEIHILDTYSDLAYKLLSKLEVDISIVNTWGILPTKLISIPKEGTINVHPSKLPQYRGAVPTLWSLKNGDTTSSVSYIVLDKGVDTGPIISQHDFSITKEDDWYSLELKIADIIKRTLIADVKNYLSGTIRPKEQKEDCATYTAKYNEYRYIDPLTERAADVVNKVHLYPYLDPGTYCYFYFKKRKIYLKKTRKYRPHSRAVNNVVHTEGMRVTIYCTDGAFDLLMFIDVSVKDSIYLLSQHKNSK